jgi:hypothetical protein
MKQDDCDKMACEFITSGNERFGIRAGKYFGCARARNVSLVILAFAIVPYPPKPKAIAKATVAHFISVRTLDRAAAKDSLKPQGPGADIAEAERAALIA